MFRAEFLALQNIKIWRWQFFDIESLEPERNVKLKKTHYFAVILSILYDETVLSRFLKP